MVTQTIKSNELVVPYMPQVPGLRFRPFQGEADYPRMLAVIQASKVADQIDRSDTLEDIARNYAHLTNSDPIEDMIFAEVKGEVVGYGRVEWHLNDKGEWLGFHLAFLHPEWRGMGIGMAILRHQEGRLRQIAERLRTEGVIAPEKLWPANPRPGNPGYFETYVMDTETGREALLQREGYLPARVEHFMRRDLSEPIEIPPMPEGLEVRRVAPDQARAVWDAATEAFRDHWNFVEPSEHEFQSFAEGRTFDPGLWMVAWDGEQVAGSVQNFVDLEENQEYGRKRGYTEGISVRRPYRKRGLATALLTRSLQMFKDMGMEEAALGVDSQNLSGAFRLYELVGFRVYKRMTLYRKPILD